MNEWIDATVEQPNPYEAVLALEDGKSYCIAYVDELWTKGGAVKYRWCIPGLPLVAPNVTHWMPLPEKPGKGTR
jgi:hypothetical protein